MNPVIMYPLLRYIKSSNVFQYQVAGSRTAGEGPEHQHGGRSVLAVGTGDPQPADPLPQGGDRAPGPAGDGAADRWEEDSGWRRGTWRSDVHQVTCGR